MCRFLVLLSVFIAVLFGTVSPSTSSVVFAQEASPAAESGSIPPLLMAWADAWSSGDPAQVVALYAPNGVYEEIPTGVVSQGPDEISAFVAETLASLSDVKVTPRSGFQADDWAVMEADFSGKPADGGASFSIPFIVVFELEDGKIVRNADYFDLYSFMDQLGKLPASGAATPTVGTPTP